VGRGGADIRSVAGLAAHQRSQRVCFIATLCNDNVRLNSCHREHLRSCHREKRRDVAIPVARVNAVLHDACTLPQHYMYLPPAHMMRSPVTYDD
jgi:hypothetical protein